MLSCGILGPSYLNLRDTVVMPASAGDNNSAEACSDALLPLRPSVPYAIHGVCNVALNEDERAAAKSACNMPTCCSTRKVGVIENVHIV